MSQQFQQLVQDLGQQAVVQNQAIPNEQNEAVMNEAQQTIQDNIQQMAQNGQFQEMTQHIQSGQDALSHPAAQQIQNNVASNLMNKLGISNSAASGVAASLVPSLLNKVCGSNSGFDLNGLLSSFTGNGGGLKNTINNIGGKLGLDKNGDGNVGLDDLKSLL